MSESLPRYAQVINQRGDTVTQLKQRRERLEWEKQEKKRREHENARVLEDRRSAAHDLGRQKKQELYNLLKETGLQSFVREACTAFGRLKDDDAVPHDFSGRPKKVGAWSTDFSYYVVDWEENTAEPQRTWVEYAISGVGLNYLKREQTPVGTRYLLSRHIILLGYGALTDGKMLVRQGDVPPVVFDQAGVHTGKFKEALSETIKNQDNIIVGHPLFQKGGKVLLAPSLQTAEVFDEDKAPDYLQALDQELTKFAQKYFVPINEQARR